jgi:hypothetical protein
MFTSHHTNIASTSHKHIHSTPISTSITSTPHQHYFHSTPTLLPLHTNIHYSLHTNIHYSLHTNIHYVFHTNIHSTPTSLLLHTNIIHSPLALLLPRTTRRQSTLAIIKKRQPLSSRHVKTENSRNRKRKTEKKKSTMWIRKLIPQSQHTIRWDKSKSFR